MQLIHFLIEVHAVLILLYNYPLRIKWNLKNKKRLKARDGVKQMSFLSFINCINCGSKSVFVWWLLIEELLDETQQCCAVWLGFFPLKQFFQTRPQHLYLIIVFQMQYLFLYVFFMWVYCHSAVAEATRSISICQSVWGYLFGCHIRNFCLLGSFSGWVQNVEYFFSTRVH